MTRQRTRCDQVRRSAYRRPGITPGRRLALALALALALVGCWDAVALADNSGQPVQVIIYPPSGGIITESVTLQQLKQQPCPTYTGPPIELYQNGTLAPGRSNNPSSTWSLGAVLGCLNNPPVPIRAVVKIWVEQSGAPEQSQASTLLPADLGSPSDFLTSSEAPLITSDGTGIIYDRPRRTSGDANAQDEVVVPDPAPFVFEVLERTLLGATVTASANPVPVGATVSFSASAPGMGSGQTYSWDFGGAAPSETIASPSVTFTSAGTYPVIVRVTDSAGNVAQSNPFLVKVGSAIPSSPNGPANGPTSSSGKTPGGVLSNRKQRTPGTGSNGSNATTGSSKNTHNAAGHAPTAGSGSGTNGSGPSRSGSSSARGATANRSAGGGRAQHPGGRRGGHVVTPAKRPRSPTTGPATLVTGRLISHVTPLPAGASPLVHAVPGPPATAPSARRTITASILPAFAAALGVFLLFSVGAGRELRVGRNLRHLLFGR